ncbi:flagellar motor switch protein FliG [Candidatus Poribacteria bacterium]
MGKPGYFPISGLCSRWHSGLLPDRLVCLVYVCLIGLRNHSVPGLYDLGTLVLQPEKREITMADQNMAEQKISTKPLTGRQKVAALLIALGSDACAEIFKILDDREVEQLVSLISRMENVEPDAISAIIEEFYTAATAGISGIQGGMSYATEVLNKALGTENSLEAIERMSSSTKSFDLFTASPTSTELLFDTVQDEHPQTIALILVHIQEQRAAEILALLPPDLQTEVVTRIANMTTVSPEVISQIEEALQAKSSHNERVSTGGVRDAAEILNRVDSDVEKRILESISQADSDLAEEISDLMFTYDDVVMITDAGIQKLVQEVNESDLIMALRASTDLIKNKFLNNMSERKRETIQEDLDNLPPVRLKDALAAQRQILTVAKEMSQSGKIEILRDKNEEVFV